MHSWVIRHCKDWLFLRYLILCWASPLAQTVKSLPAVWETWVRSLGWEDPLEKETASCFSILAWKIPGMEEPGVLQSMGLQRVGHDWATKHTILCCAYLNFFLRMWNKKYSPFKSPGSYLFAFLPTFLFSAMFFGNLWPQRTLVVYQ